MGVSPGRRRRTADVMNCKRNHGNALQQVSAARMNRYEGL